MSNVLVPKGVDRVYGKNIDTTADPIVAAVVRGYTYSSAHQYLSDLTGAGGSVLATDTLTGKSQSLGVFDANDLAFGAIASGAAAAHVVMYHNTGTASSSTLLAVWDTATGLPLTPNGNTVTGTLDNGTNKIWKVG